MIPFRGFRKNSQLSFSQLRIQKAPYDNLRRRLGVVLLFLRDITTYIKERLFLLLKVIGGLVSLIFKMERWVKFYVVKRLIWSQGRVGRAVANFAIIVLCLSVFLTGGVFQSSFVKASNANVDYIAGSNDIIPEKIMARTQVPQDRMREDYLEHIVQPGDSLSTIGQNYGVPVDALRYANNIVSDYLKVGQKLLIPPVSGVIHTVKSGDTLVALASKYTVSTQAIVDFNYLDGPPFNISVGQKLIIPGAKIPVPVIVPAIIMPRYGPDAYGNIPYAGIGVKGTGQFAWPAKYRAITQYFSWYHPGVDIAKSPSPIYASDSGTVVRAGWWTNGYGFAVQIDHGNGYVTTYGHMSRIDVSVGEEVEMGDVLGQMGSTGNSTGPHVHFTVQYQGKFLDPLSVL